jgi:hypothetical protein
MIKTTGNFYIKKSRTSDNWSVYYQSWESGKRYQKRVERLAYQELGFRSNMDFAEAKLRCIQLNAERKLNKDKIRKTAERVVSVKILNETIFPEIQVSEFLNKLEEENFGSAYNFKKTIFYFNFVQKMIVELKLVTPSDYKDNVKMIYRYLLKQKVSISYSKKILSMLNRWGKFQARLRGSFFEPVSIPRGREKSAIEEAHLTKKGAKSASDSLTPELLEFIKPKISIERYNWLYLSVWLGLRPEEIDTQIRG